MLWKMFPHLISVFFFRPSEVTRKKKKILLSACIKFLSFKNGVIFDDTSMKVF